jgi:hypothetical protein
MAMSWCSAPEAGQGSWTHQTRSSERKCRICVNHHATAGHSRRGALFSPGPRGLCRRFITLIHLRGPVRRIITRNLALFMQMIWPY